MAPVGTGRPATRESNTTVSSLVRRGFDAMAAARESLETSVMSGEVGLRPTHALHRPRQRRAHDRRRHWRFMTRRRGPSFGMNRSAARSGPWRGAYSLALRGCTRMSLMVVVGRRRHVPAEGCRCRADRPRQMMLRAPARAGAPLLQRQLDAGDAYRRPPPRSRPNPVNGLRGRLHRCVTAAATTSRSSTTRSWDRLRRHVRHRVGGLDGHHAVRASRRG
jgi:hypothetical protein